MIEEEFMPKNIPVPGGILQRPVIVSTH